MSIYKTIYAEKNNCYIYNKDSKRKPVGIVLHSTGVDNAALSRYVQPLNYVTDTKLGVNKYGNDWVNNAKPGGQEICCHAFIGKLADGKVATVQILPWDIPDWNSGKGDYGRAWQEGYIEIEICEDKTDKNYFNAIYAETIVVIKSLCEKFKIPVCKVTDIKKGGISDHSEMNAIGYASAHVDVGHWFSKFGKSMDTLRADIANAMKKPTPTQTPTPTPTKEVLYRVRKTWADVGSQVGAFKELENAKKCAKDNKCSVFDEDGKLVYAPQ
jgi:N-acetylmuramoyl-L-alanine amidase